MSPRPFPLPRRQCACQASMLPFPAAWYPCHCTDILVKDDHCIAALKQRTDLLGSQLP